MSRYNRQRSWKDSFDQRAKDLREALDKFDAHEIDWLFMKNGSRWGLRAWVGNGIIALRSSGKGCKVVWARCGTEMRKPLRYSVNTETAKLLIRFLALKLVVSSVGDFQLFLLREASVIHRFDVINTPSDPWVAIMVAAQNRKGLRLTVKQVAQLAGDQAICQAAADKLDPGSEVHDHGAIDWEGLFAAGEVPKR